MTSNERELLLQIGRCMSMLMAEASRGHPHRTLFEDVRNELIGSMAKVREESPKEVG